jgi:hypothetical protein
MDYFVTGATGFIGKRLVRKLLARPDSTVHFLTRSSRAGEARVALRLLGRRAQPHPAGGGRPQAAASRRRQGGAEAAEGEDRPLLPPRRALRPGRLGRGGRGRQHRRHAPHAGLRRSHRGRPLPPHELHRRRRHVRGHLPRGHVRRGGEPRPPLLPHQARVREGIVRKECKVPWRIYRPASVVGDSRTGEMDKIDGPYYFFKIIQKLRKRAAAVAAHRRPRRRPHQHRAGRLRRRRHGPHRPPGGRGRQVLPPHRPASAPRRRRAADLRPRRPRPRHGHAHQRRPARLHPEGRQEEPDGAHPGAAHPQGGDEGPRPARRHPRLRQLPDALRLPRDRTRAEGHGVAVPPLETTPGGCGTTGSATSIPTCSSTAR